MFVGDAKATETSDNWATRLRLRRYAAFAVAYVAAGGIAVGRRTRRARRRGRFLWTALLRDVTADVPAAQVRRGACTVDVAFCAVTWPEVPPVRRTTGVVARHVPGDEGGRLDVRETAYYRRGSVIYGWTTSPALIDGERGYFVVVYDSEIGRLPGVLWRRCMPSEADAKALAIYMYELALDPTVDFLSDFEVFTD